MQSVTRRWALSALALGLGAALAPRTRAAAAGWPAEAPLGPAAPFSFERLKQRARALAAKPYRASPGLTADQLRAIDYDAWAAAVYKPQAALWGGAPGSQGVRFFPRGRAAPLRVAMHVVEDGQAREVLYSPGLFDMPPGSPIRALGPDAGFGGFRVMNADHATDWLSFLGASYFRSSDPMNQYGLSARGLAIDTATPGPEEFPAFTSCWIGHAPDGRLMIWALLEGPSVAGAYQFAHTRSAQGLVQDITVQLSLRRPVARLGLAPLTSMYWYGQSDRPPDGDWRPQVHDSDGLAIWTGAGERIWRPLADPSRVVTDAYSDRSPRGFGLVQRDRNFADFQDDGIFYERRPTAWVEPVGKWGEGSVQLVEIPTAGETQDNVVAFWSPARPPAPGAALDLRYRLHWTADEPFPVGAARVVATRFGRAAQPGRRRFVVDFAGGALGGLARGAAQATVTASPAQPIAATAYPVVGQGQGVWRLLFDVDMPPGARVDLRAYLHRGGEALTETWLYGAG